jgi:pyruvate,water dikinase
MGPAVAVAVRSSATAEDLPAASFAGQHESFLNIRGGADVVGVIFTLDTESGFRDVVFVTGSYGLGENVVQGTVEPDEFYVHKPTFRRRHRAVLRCSLGQKQLTMMLRGGHIGSTTQNEATPPEKRARFCRMISTVPTPSALNKTILAATRASVVHCDLWRVR